ncbi:myosin heavy chain, cardiac muscle isoform-like isoform X2 [Corticium candelabrum]|nr:myosin heavy chain, cardiac muscle isoform-like isoform X2 [Corticium candelabrum]
MESQMKLQERIAIERATSVVDDVTDKHQREMTDLLVKKLESEKQSQAEIAQLSGRLQSLEISYSQLKETAGLGDATHCKNSETLDALRHELSEAHNIAEKLRSTNRSLLTQTNRMQQQIDFLNNEVETSRKQVNCKLQARITKLEAQQSKLKTDKRDLDEQLTQSRKNFNQLRQEMQKVTQEHCSCETTISKLQETLRHREQQLSMKAVAPRNVQGKLQELEGKCSRLSCDLEQAIKNGEIALGSIAEQDSLVSSLQASNECLQSDLEECNQERRTLHATVEQLKCEVAELQARLKLQSGRSQDFAEYVQLKRELLVLRDQNEQLQHELKKRSKDNGSSDHFKLLRRRSQHGVSYSRVLSITPCQSALDLTQGRTSRGPRAGSM